ncbi:transcriptional regulator [bacterium 336/3]|nr:transcriptional regulator [bacterium 336/3]
MKVLIVDDEPNILMSLDFLMRKEGYDVLVARNGKEALESLENNEPDMVLLDIMMPDVDGYEICQYIRKQENLQNCKVIFLSAKAKEADIQKGYEAGADFYMTKPFSNKNLIGKVKELLLYHE